MYITVGARHKGGYWGASQKDFNDLLSLRSSAYLAGTPPLLQCTLSRLIGLCFFLGWCVVTATANRLEREYPEADSQIRPRIGVRCECKVLALSNLPIGPLVTGRPLFAAYPELLLGSIFPAPGKMVELADKIDRSPSARGNVPASQSVMDRKLSGLTLRSKLQLMGMADNPYNEAFDSIRSNILFSWTRWALSRCHERIP